MSKKSLNCIAFDIGASGGKVVLGQYSNNRIVTTEVYRFPNASVQLSGHMYWDFLHLFEEVKKGLKLAYNSVNGQVASIGLDTWGVDCGFLSKTGHLLENPFSYRDPRTIGIMEKAFQKMPREEIYTRTGVQFMQMNTLFQLYSILEEDANFFDGVGTCLMIPDLFNYFFTGIKVCELTNASTTQFLNPHTINWDEDILNSMGIPGTIFPQIIEPGTVLGDLSPWLCEEIGINPIPVVAVASHDTASAFSAIPLRDDANAFLSSGTWSLLGTESPVPVINQKGLLHNFSNYAGVSNTWYLWKNIQALWLLQECKQSWANSGKHLSHEDIILMASQAKPFGPILDSDDLDFFAPGDFPQKIIKYCHRTNQPPPDSEGAIARCILESLALKYRYTINNLQDVVGRNFTRLFVIGGGSRNWLLNKFTAEAIGIPVEAGPDEATSIGNLMQQLIALDEIDSLENSRHIIKNSFTTASYDCSYSPGWDQAYERYSEIISKSNTFNQ